MKLVRLGLWCGRGLILTAFLLFGCSEAEEDTRSNRESSLDCIQSSIAPSISPEVGQLATTTADWLESLSDDQLASAHYCLGDREMYTWSNLPPPRSGGLPLADMNASQQELSWQVVNEFLSDEGHKRVQFLATDIEQASGAGPIDAYTLAVFGDPSKDGVWGVQFDGHHVALNFQVHASNVILAPMFIGTQPRSVDHYTPLAVEYDMGRDLIALLDEPTKSKAYEAGLVRRDVFVGAGRRHFDTNQEFDYTEFGELGILVSEFNQESLELLKQLVTNYISYLSEPFAREVFGRLVPHLKEGRFAFSSQGNRIYYRVYVADQLLIEYSDVGSDHIHTITRLLGQPPYRDYGGLVQMDHVPATLEEHYLLAEHHQHDDVERLHK